MSCNSLNLEIRQKTLFQNLLVFKDQNALVDLSGYQFRSVAKLDYAGAAAFTFTFQIKNQITNKGEVIWELSSDQTAALDISEDTVYIYDVLMIQPDTEPKSIISGSVTIQPVITP